MRKSYPSLRSYARARTTGLSLFFLLFSIGCFSQTESQSVFASGLNHPVTVFMDKSDRLFFTNGNNVQIYPSTLFAGTGVAGSSGDGGPATSAQLNQPYGIFEDPDGNVYIGTRGDNKIRKVATNGTISTFAGNGTAGYSGDGGQATQAKLAGINGLWGDQYGNIYVSDSVHAVVRKIDTTGTITTLAGTGVPGYSGDGGPATAAQLFRPNGIGVDANRNIYIGDDSINAVRKIDTTGKITTLIGGNFTKGLFDGDSATSMFGNITNITVDDLGNVYIIDAGYQLLRCFNSRLNMMSPINNANIEQPGSQPFTSFTIDPTGQFFAGDTIDEEIWNIGINYNVPGGDSVSQYIYAPLPGHPLTSYFDTYIFDDPIGFASGENRIATLQPAQLAPLPAGAQLPSGIYSFVVAVDSFQLYGGVPLSNRHFKIVAPPGQDSAQDVIQFWFTQMDANNYDNYLSSLGSSDPTLTGSSPLQESYINVTPLNILFFHGADNTPTHQTGPVEELPAQAGYDYNANANNPFADPVQNYPGDNSYYIVTVPATHGLAGNFYFTTGTIAPLPLTLLSFTAVPQGQDAVLNWATTNEVNTKVFLVQRSTDTTNFAVEGSVAATGTSGSSGAGETNNYGYTDKGLAPGLYYYRLQMEDQDGKSTYSPIRSVTIGGTASGGFVLYPNPAKDVLYCQVSAAAAGRYIVQLTNGQGNVLQTKEVSLPAGQTTISFIVTDLPSGVYFVTVSDGSSKQTGQFVK